MYNSNSHIDNDPLNVVMAVTNHPSDDSGRWSVMVSAQWSSIVPPSS